MNRIDITDKVDFDNNDDEYLPLNKCVCGKEFPRWEFTLGIYDDMPTECPACHRKMFFRLGITVYEIVE